MLMDTKIMYSLNLRKFISGRSFVRRSRTCTPHDLLVLGQSVGDEPSLDHNDEHDIEGEIETEVDTFLELVPPMVELKTWIRDGIPT